MSFGGNSTKSLPAPPQKALGLDESRASTNEQARPLPYFAGKTRVGVTWITDAFDVRAEAVTSSAGKGQTTVRGYNYYANLAAVVCHGPVDAIEKVYFNGDVVWESQDGPLECDNDIYTDITLENHSKNNARLYWGTAEQDLRPDLIGTFRPHPRYPRQCVIYFNKVYFGFNQTSAPNVELVIARYPAWPWTELEDAPLVNINGDCNPVAVICELLTNPIYGLGWPVERLDQTGLLTVAAQLAAEEIGISPYITKQTGARQLIAQVCEYFDGYPLITPEGKFTLGLMRPPADVDALPLIDESMLIEEPELDTETWRGVKTKTWVKFNDRTRDYKENAFSYRAPGVAQLAGDNTPQTLERMWVTNPQFAQKLVAAAGRAAALPATGGSIRVRKSAGLNPGDLFRFSYAHLGIEELVMRVVSRAEARPGSRDVSLEVTLDRAYLNETYYLPDEDEAAEEVDTSPKKFVTQSMLELPRGLADAERITLSPMVVRPNFYTTGYNIHLRQNYNLASVQFYTVVPAAFGTGTLADNYLPGSIVDESYTLRVTYPSALAAQLATLANEYRLIIQRLPPTGWKGSWMLRELMIVIGWEPEETPEGPLKYAKAAVIRARQGTQMQYAPAGQGVSFHTHPTPLVTFSYTSIGEHNRFPIHGTLHQSYPERTDLIDLTTGLVVNVTDEEVDLESPSLNNAFFNDLLLFAGDEIISIAEVDLISTNRYRVWGIRARYDTVAQAHEAGEEVFLCPRKELKQLTHTSFLRGSRHTFKLQSKVLSKVLDLSEVELVKHHILDRVHQPLCPTNLKAQGDGHAPYITSGADTLLSWTLRESAPRDFWSRWHDNPAPVPAKTMLEFLTLADEVRHTRTTAAAANTAEYSHADRADHFGADTVSFKVRAYAQDNGLTSRYYNELTITVN
jgi:hypothetical protein